MNKSGNDDILPMTITELRQEVVKLRGEIRELNKQVADATEKIAILKHEKFMSEHDT